MYESQMSTLVTEGMMVKVSSRIKRTFVKVTRYWVGTVKSSRDVYWVSVGEVGFEVVGPTEITGSIQLLVRSCIRKKNKEVLKT